MSTLTRFLVHEVTLSAPVLVTDRYGGTVPDWTQPPAATFTESGWLTRTASEEMGQGREAITDTYELTLPATSAINGTMRVERAGETFEIRGSIERAEAPAGTHHLIVHLRRVQG